MSRHAKPLLLNRTAGGEPPLPRLREADVSGLALWAAVFMASSTLLAFLAADPARAWQPTAPDPVLASGSAEAKRPTAPRTEAGSESWH